MMTMGGNGTNTQYSGEERRSIETTLNDEYLNVFTTARKMGKTRDAVREIGQNCSIEWFSGERG